MSKLRIMITGFGPFPGAPWNPTGPLVARLIRLRRPALADVALASHIFPVTYRAVDQELEAEHERVLEGEAQMYPRVARDGAAEVRGGEETHSAPDAEGHSGHYYDDADIFDDAP